jgi:hypothetical protein
MAAMRTKSTILFGVLLLAFACLIASTGLDAGERDKKPPEKVSAEEIEKLVKELGSSSFAKRAEATRLLRDTPRSLHYLRQRSTDRNLELEERRRIETLITDICQLRFKRRLEALAKEKSDAPLDLLTDLLLENREHVTDHEWALTIEIVSSIADKLSQAKKKFNVLGYDQLGQVLDHRKFPTIIGKNVFLSPDEIGRRRIIADRLALKSRERPGFASIIAVLSERIDSDISICGESILLFSGDRGSRPSWTRDLGMVISSFVYCDGDFHGGEISGCVFVIGGRLKSDPPKNSIVIENSRKSAHVKCFTVEDIGLKMIRDAKTLRVANVTPGSKAALSGFKVGDILITDLAGDDALFKLERNIRRAYAGFTEIILMIRRNDRAEKIVLSFAE